MLNSANHISASKWGIRRFEIIISFGIDKVLIYQFIYLQTKVVVFFFSTRWHTLHQRQPLSLGRDWKLCSRMCTVFISRHTSAWIRHTVELVQTRSQSLDAGVSEESVLDVLGGARATGPQWELNHRSRHLPACPIPPVRVALKWD